MNKNKSAAAAAVRIVAVMAVLALCGLLLSRGACAEEKIPARPEKEIVSEMIYLYGEHQSEADPQIDDLLDELDAANADTGARWRAVMDYWRYTTNELVLSYDRLPEEVADGDDLCIVVLGYQLNSDGTMREELIGRLTTALGCAQSHPGAWVLCTGGGTASGAPEATEADRMAEWLIANGVDESRVLVENRSLTTAQNAKLSYGLLREGCPQVSRLAIVTSDYHVAWGSVLFQAQLLLAANDPAAPDISVVANAAYKAPDSHSFTFGAQASGLRELAELSRGQ